MPKRKTKTKNCPSEERAVTPRLSEEDKTPLRRFDTSSEDEGQEANDDLSFLSQFRDGVVVGPPATGDAMSDAQLMETLRSGYFAREHVRAQKQRRGHESDTDSEEEEAARQRKESVQFKPTDADLLAQGRATSRSHPGRVFDTSAGTSGVPPARGMSAAAKSTNVVVPTPHSPSPETEDSDDLPLAEVARRMASAASGMLSHSDSDMPLAQRVPDATNVDDIHMSSDEDVPLARRVAPVVNAPEANIRTRGDVARGRGGRPARTRGRGGRPRGAANNVPAPNRRGVGGRPVQRPHRGGRPNVGDRELEAAPADAAHGDAPPDGQALRGGPRRVVLRCRTYMAAATRDEALMPQLYLGPMTIECRGCKALHFEGETRSSADRQYFVSCCQGGKVRIAPRDCPRALRKLYTDQSPRAKAFRDRSMAYNAQFAMATYPGEECVAHMEGEAAGNSGFVFRVNGQCHHANRPVAHPRGEEARDNQVYFLDADEARALRVARGGLDATVVDLIDGELRAANPLVRDHLFMGQVLEQARQVARAAGRPVQSVRLAVVDKSGGAPNDRRFDVPTTPHEIAVLFSGDEAPRNLHLQVYLEGQEPRLISSLEPSVDALTYPLLFPCGEPGWRMGMPHEGPRRTAVRNTVTQNQFYAHLLHYRRSFSPLFRAGRLFQMFAVDAWVKVEGSRLRWIEANQALLECETLRVIMDYVDRVADEQGLEVGKVVYLPASFTGGLQCLTALFLDALAAIRRFGKPDLFLTFTSNPFWREVQENLLQGQLWWHRPDLVGRVFDLKFHHLRRAVEVGQIFGICRSFIYSIEFQKRGLPHAHCVISLAEENKIRTSEDIDRLVCASVPDVRVHPITYDKIGRRNVHAPCGERFKDAPCMVDGNCNKGFPKLLSPETIFNDGTGKPRYQRLAATSDEDPGLNLSYRNGTMDSTRIVPYNAYLSLTYDCHINLEATSSIKCLKYIMSYIFKGSDCLTVRADVVGEGEEGEEGGAGGGVVDYDEPATYLNMRYVSASEAVHRLMNYKMHGNSHRVDTLAVHLPNEQNVLFRRGAEQEAVDRAEGRDSTLTAYFKANVGPHRAVANTLLYDRMPDLFTWNERTRAWDLRQRNKYEAVARLAEVSPRQTERFHLRILLCNVRGAGSFEELRTHQGVVHDTFKGACVARQLLALDQGYDHVLEQASLSRKAGRMRVLFAHLMVHCELADPQALFERFEEHLVRDYVERRHMTPEQAVLRAKHYIRTVVQRCGGQVDIAFFADLGDVNEAADWQQEDDVVAMPAPAEHVATRIASLNGRQRNIFDAVVASVDRTSRGLFLPSGEVFFVLGAGGTGKTFLYNVLIDHMKEHDVVVLPAAFTGIAALLLRGGNTLHYTFGLPLNITAQSTSSIKRQDAKAQLLRQAGLLIIDEAPMAHRQVLDVIDRLLRMVTGHDLLMGGKTVIMGGDFRQLLPVVVNATQQQAAMASLLFWPQWRHVTVFNLTENRRVAPGEEEFSTYLEALGEGRHIQPEGHPRGDFEVDERVVMENRLQLLASVFEGDPAATGRTRVVLTPTNQAALELNDVVVESMPGELRECLSADTPETQVEPGHDLYMPAEAINSMTPSGLPPHVLKLKIGAIVMLLRNMDLGLGLCNGTRLQVNHMQANVLGCTIVSGEHRGQQVFIPRMRTKYDGHRTLMPFSREQFPLRLSFVMTINKAQGQTFRKIGLYLPQPVFSHGHIYVAFSRVSRLQDLSVLIDDRHGVQGRDRNRRSFTKNVVDRQVIARAFPRPPP